MNLPARIFIIYAHEDASFKDELINALSPLKLQGRVLAWHDGDIQAGQVWDEAIRQQLDEADIIIPLISHYFFSSESIQQTEIRRAFERYEAGECLIVPVIARACVWESDPRLAKLKVLPVGGKPISSWDKNSSDEAYHNVVLGLMDLIEPHSTLPPVIPASNVGKRVNPLKIAGLVVAVVLAIILWFQYQTYAAEKAEKTAYTTAFQTGNIPAIKRFCNDFPQGLFIDSARQHLNLLQTRFDSCFQAARALKKGGESSAALETAAAAAQLNPDDPELKKLMIELNR